MTALDGKEEENRKNKRMIVNNLKYNNNELLFKNTTECNQIQLIPS